MKTQTPVVLSTIILMLFWIAMPTALASAVPELQPFVPLTLSLRSAIDGLPTVAAIALGFGLCLVYKRVMQ